MSNSIRSERAVVVMGRLPRAGQVKTRLVPPLTAEEAARLYRAFLLDVFRLVDRAHEEAGPRAFDRVFACALEPKARPEDGGQIEALVPRGWRGAIQRGDDLGARIAASADDAGAARVVVIGSDSPTMPPSRIAQAFDALEARRSDRAHRRAVLGPADDGGYYLIGFDAPAPPELFSDMPWSSPALMARTRERAKASGVELLELAQGYDVDTLADLERAFADANLPESNAAETSAAIRELLASGALPRLTVPP